MAFYSRTLSKPEQNYCVTRLELLAVESVKHFHKYFYGQQFRLRTDRSFETQRKATIPINLSETIFVSPCSMVLLNRSTIPSDLGWRGVVRVL
ncbi:RNase H-like domain-containing protein [Staphylococcus aureus]